MSNKEQELKEFNYGTAEDFLTTTGENSTEVMLAEVLIDKGLKGLRIDQPLGSAGKGAKGIFGTKRAREIMERIDDTPEFDVIFKACDVPDIRLNASDFADLTLQEFKGTKLQEELITLQLKKEIENLKRIFLDFSGYPDMKKSVEKKEQNLTFFIDSGVHIPTDEEIKKLIEAIVDANTTPEDFKEESQKAKETLKPVDLKVQNRTLRANEVADLDPYGVRK